jgi:pimeloyl-ACP methyl ester carboxylesterase
LVAFLGIGTANKSISISKISSNGLPITLFMPTNPIDPSRPLVLVAHGFAGSENLMRGFSLTLAHAGYNVASWDFDGHGSNSRPWEPAELVHNPEEVIEVLAGHGFTDSRLVAILGHSMGSGVALDFGLKYPEIDAVIAISPVRRELTIDSPNNLLVIAGAMEPAFIQNGRELIKQAGGIGGDPESGNAREFKVIPGVEHVSILFSPRTHAEARSWLDFTFGAQPGGITYIDWRIVWYGLGLLGNLLIGIILANSIFNKEQSRTASLSKWRLLISLLSGVISASLLLSLAGYLGLGLSDLLGLLIGGYLLFWFGFAGIIALFLSGIRPNLPSRIAVFAGLVTFIVLWLGVGLLGHYVWLNWLLVPQRLILWPLGAAFLFPWFLVMGKALSGSSNLTQIGWWLGNSAIIVVGLLLAFWLNPALRFILIILPLFPLVLGIHALIASPYRGGWAYAVSGALFVSWMVIAVFPLI